MGDAKPRGESLLPTVLGEITTEAGRAAGRARTGKGQSASKAASARIGAYRVEERKVVELFPGRRVVIPPKAVIRRQFGSDLPGIISVKCPDGLARIPGANRSAINTPAADGSEQESGDRISRVATRQAGCGSSEVIRS